MESAEYTFPFDTDSTHRSDYVAHKVERRQLASKKESKLEETAFDSNSSYRSWQVPVGQPAPHERTSCRP